MGDADTLNSSVDSPNRSYVHSLPSDYSDVQSESYDPEFISDISSKMQVPDKLGVAEDFDNSPRNNFISSAYGMNVPDRILISEGGRHIGARGGIRQFEFEKPAEHTGMEYVGLITPPRTLTLEEAFPTVEPQDEEENENNSQQLVRLPNGDISHADPYTPGASLNDSVLMNEVDEVTKLHVQVRKLSRRLDMVEADNKKFMNGFKMFTMGYCLWKFCWWMFNRSKN